MIVKNEENVLARCLEGIKSAVDEIIIADTGSTDKTKEIAKFFGAKVYDFPWKDDFSSARNFSFSKATGDYLLWLDADDVIETASLDRLYALKKRLALTPADTVMCAYITAIDENGNPTFKFYRERIVSAKSKPVWQGFIHEYIEQKGEIIYSDFYVTHLKPTERVLKNPFRNLNIYIKNISQGEVLSARDKYYYGRELYYNKLYDESIAVLNSALKEKNLWYVNAIEALTVIADCQAEMKNSDEAISALYKTFDYGAPRASVLYRLGKLYADRGLYDASIIFLKGALSAKDCTIEGDFDEPKYRNLYPLIELTYCYSMLNDNDTAYEYHRRAKKISETDLSVKHNDEYFSSLGYNG